MRKDYICVQILIEKIIQVAAIFFVICFCVYAHALDCTKIGSTCVEGAEWRIVDGYRVHQNCWKYEDQFDCKYNGKSDCESLIKEGCYQADSSCLKEVRGKCVHFKQLYHCKREREVEHTEEEIKQVGSQKDFLKDIGCNTDIKYADGSCVDTSYKSNDELAEAMARISVLKGMKNNFKAINEDGKYEFFKGEVQTCKIDVINFRNCCHLGKDKGWGGKDLLNMWGCKPEENKLREERKASKCHYVGKYCAARDPVFKICLEEKEAYCCFQSDLVKVIQEQGRSQIGRGWGTPEEPDCRGFIEDTKSETGTGKHQLSELKFEDMDFKEVHHRWSKVDDRPDKKASEIQDLKREFSRIQENFESKTGTLKGSNPDIELPDDRKNDTNEKGEFINKGGL